MDLFVAICHDRHIDEMVTVWSTPELAIQFCREFVPEGQSLRVEYLTPGMKSGGWIFYGTYSCEDDYVYVIKTTLDGGE